VPSGGVAQNVGGGEPVIQVEDRHGWMSTQTRFVQSDHGIVRQSVDHRLDGQSAGSAPWPDGRIVRKQALQTFPAAVPDERLDPRQLQRVHHRPGRSARSQDEYRTGGREESGRSVAETGPVGVVTVPASIAARQGVHGADACGLGAAGNAQAPQLFLERNGHAQAGDVQFGQGRQEIIRVGDGQGKVEVGTAPALEQPVVQAGGEGTFHRISRHAI